MCRLSPLILSRFPSRRASRRGTTSPCPSATTWPRCAVGAGWGVVGRAGAGRGGLEQFSPPWHCPPHSLRPRRCNPAGAARSARPVPCEPDGPSDTLWVVGGGGGVSQSTGEDGRGGGVQGEMLAAPCREAFLRAGGVVRDPARLATCELDSPQIFARMAAAAASRMVVAAVRTVILRARLLRAGDVVRDPLEPPQRRHRPLSVPPFPARPPAPISPFSSPTSR